MMPLKTPVKANNRLADLLQARGWSERTLASQTGLGESYINRLKNGRVKSPSLVTAGKIARALGVTVEEVFPVQARGKRG